MKVLYLFFLFGFFLQAQELPPVINFSTKDYEAGNQNWMITQDDNHYTYIANNSGLLRFDGEHWQLYKLPDASFIRSVSFIDKKIFSGSYMDFGYWENNEEGQLSYTSLKDLVGMPFADGEQFWHIEAVGDYVVFQSLQRLYSYNLKSKKISIITSESAITHLFKHQDKLYYQVVNEGLYVIDKGSQNLILPHAEIQNQIIVGIYNYKGENFVVFRNEGIKRIENDRLVHVELDKLENLDSQSVFIAKLISEKILALGMIGNGLKLYDLETQKLIHFKQPSFINNTVLSLYNDDRGNLWCGLDNGLSLVNSSSSVKIYTDTFGDIGTVYCSYKNDETQYIGTNQGLYIKEPNHEGGFKLVPNTSGQVWSIQKVNNKLFVGHDKGTFVIEDKMAKRVYPKSGTWEVKAFKNSFLQGHYNGMSFSRDGVNFKHFKNYTLSSRNIVVDKNNTVWVGHDHKGVYKLDVSLDKEEIDVLKNYNFNDGNALAVFEFYNELYVSTTNNIYRYHENTDAFEIDDTFNSLFKNEERITGISKVLDKSWWAFGHSYIYQVTKDAFQGEFDIVTTPIPQNLRSITAGFENISSLGNSKFLIGSNTGYITFQLPFETQDVKSLNLNTVEVAKKGDNYVNISVENDNIELPYQQNYISFTYSVPQYNLLNDVNYSYQLKGYSNEWSGWTTSSNASFKNLPFGDYNFQVKAKLDDEETTAENFYFTILRPWYLSNLAIVFYLVCFLLLLWLIHHFYTNHYKKQQERIIQSNQKKLELQEITAQQEIVTLQNKQLETEVESKNRELAASTINIIKKNEFLSDLKNKLSDAKTDKEVQQVITIINNNIAEKDNWKLFKEAFDNADKDFLQSVKQKHAKLTSNDLKLCAYLRLNLSSKEIAPLLNISVRSVEIKRYRLRKKMDLKHEDGLVEYILTF